MKWLPKQKKWLILLGGGGLSTLILAAALIPGGFELVLNCRDSDESFLVVPIKPGEFFTLHYIHSVNGCPVWEKHSIDKKGTIHINEERFVAFAAGMGHWPGHGIHTSRGKYQVIKNIDKPIGNFPVRVSAEKYKQTLIWRGVTIHLSPLAAGQVVNISAVSISAFKRLWRNWFPHRTTPETAQES